MAFDAVGVGVEHEAAFIEAFHQHHSRVRHTVRSDRRQRHSVRIDRLGALRLGKPCGKKPGRLTGFRSEPFISTIRAFGIPSGPTVANAIASGLTGSERFASANHAAKSLAGSPASDLSLSSAPFARSAYRPVRPSPTP